MDKNKKVIAKKKWKKNWTANWGFLVGSLYAPIYPILVRQSFGRGIKEAIFICQNDFTSNYLPESEIKYFGKFIADKIVHKPSLAKNWTRQLNKETKKFIQLLKLLRQKEKYDAGDFKKLEQAMYAHVPVNFAVKKVGDFLPAELLERFLPDFEKARVLTEDVYNQVNFVGKKIQKFIAGQSGWPEKVCDFLSKEEIRQYFSSGILPAKNILRERSRGALFWCGAQGHAILTGAKKSAIERILVVPTGAGVVRGTTAFAGKVCGTARLIMDPTQAGEFRDGDILITGMTRPEFLPIMKKAAAFVTDAGGVLSHAAIVAREMRKPCLVGTEFATKIFKDGDLVEVDADKGVVTIINKNN